MNYCVCVCVFVMQRIIKLVETKAHKSSSYVFIVIELFTWRCYDVDRPFCVKPLAALSVTQLWIINPECCVWMKKTLLVCKQFGLSQYKRGRRRCTWKKPCSSFHSRFCNSCSPIPCRINIYIYICMFKFLPSLIASVVCNVYVRSKLQDTWTKWHLSINPFKKWNEWIDGIYK